MGLPPGEGDGRGKGKIPELKGTRYGADHALYLKLYADLIDAKLCVPLENKGTFFQEPYFLVQGDFSHLTNKVALITNKMPEALPSHCRPKREDLSKLASGQGLSLFNILRIHHAIEEINAAGIGIAHIFEGHNSTQAGLPDRSIVPSLRLVNGRDLAAERDLRDLGLIGLSRKIHERAGGRGNKDYLVDLLEKGWGKKDSPNYYRITDYLAGCIVAVLNETPRRKVSSNGASNTEWGLAKSDDLLDIDFFPLDPEWKGKVRPGEYVTTAFPFKLGNLVARLVDDRTLAVAIGVLPSRLAQEFDFRAVVRDCRTDLPIVVS